jgi:hypothetical protein
MMYYNQWPLTTAKVTPQLLTAASARIKTDRDIVRVSQMSKFVQL